jgi:D-threo-aldose 1-dehydrogenase
MEGLHRRTFRTPHGVDLAFTAMGFGTAPLGNLYRSITDAEARSTLDAAWEIGCRYFDTAPLYGLGLAETRLNSFLREHRSESPLLSTKVGRLLERCEGEARTGIGKFFDVPARRERYDYSYDGVMASIEFSFERLGVDAIDILYCHDIDVFTHGSREAADRRVAEFMSGGYRALDRLRSERVVKAIGAGVNEWQVCETLAKAGDFDLFLLAGRYTLLEQESLESLLPLCVEKGIGIVLGGPFNSGILATGPTPGAFYNYNPAPPEILERVSRIEAVCRAHGVPLAAAALNFPLAHPSVVSVIPGGKSPLELRQNLDALRHPIPSSLWGDLKRAKLLREDAPVPSSGDRP